MGGRLAITAPRCTTTLRRPIGAATIAGEPAPFRIRPVSQPLFPPAAITRAL